MFSKQKGTTASIVSVIVFVGCCAAMVADFNLWWLPLCAVPLLIICNINYKGHWESDKIDEEAEQEQSKDPYSSTWLFDALEANPSKDDVKAYEKVEEEDRVRKQHVQIPAQDRMQTEAAQEEKYDPHKIDEDI